MTIHSPMTSTQQREDTMKTSQRLNRQHRSGERGQILVIAVLGLIAMVGGVALLLEGGNAYAQQRGVQNGADAAANTGATYLGQHLTGETKTDAQVYAAMDASAAANGLTSWSAYYTNVAGDPISAASVVVAESLAAEVGGGANNPGSVIPLAAQGVHVGTARSFGTSFGRVIGINSLDAGADATAVTGRLVGGDFLPVVFPVNIVDCETNGDLGLGETQWELSGKPLAGQNHPNGQEYIVPLCKTGGGSFMVLDLDSGMTCEEEVTDPPAVKFDQFPTDVASDNGNNCANQIVDEVNDLQGKVVMVPVCDGACVTAGGSNATYHIIKVASFFIDYFSESNNPNNSACLATTSPTYGTPITPIWGNGSSSCLAGWFVRYHNTGPVGAGSIGNSDAIGIQLIK